MHRLCLFLLLLTGCSPYLRYHQDDAHAYGFSAPCGQGPFTLSTRLRGARWGEKLVIAGFARQSVAGRYVVTLDGKKISEGAFSTHRVVTNGATGSFEVQMSPQNQRCLERPAEVASAPRTAEPEQVLEPPPQVGPPPPPFAPPPPPHWQPVPVEVQPVQASPIPDPEPVAPALPVAMQAAQLISLAPDVFVEEGSRNLRVVAFSWESVDEIGTALVPPDALVQVTIWSQDPNDWEGAILQVVHEVAEPNVTEAEYMAYLRKDRRERQLEAEKNTAEANAEREKRHKHCEAHHDDEDCWGKGGYDAYVKAYYAPRPQAPAAPKPEVRVEPEAPKPHAPEGPPPAAQTETAPPQPSPHAEWINGYWHWTGFAWFWLVGWWKVPPQDLVAQTTVVAPAPPPQLVVEIRPPPPLPTAVWLAGAWYWDGRIWLWHAGQWTLPPRPGLQWLAPVWVLDGHGVRLVPGSWGDVLGLPRR